MRTSSISAAASGRSAALHLGMPLSSICQVRERTRIDSAAAKRAAARAFRFAQRNIVGDRRHDLDASDKMGELGDIGQHHQRIGADIVLLAQLLQAPPPTSPFISASNRSITRVRSARPSMVRTSSARTVPAACAIA